jgi:MFS family permease
MEQKNTLLFLFLLILLSFVSYLVPSTFYPEVALEKGCGLGVIGGIISLFPIGGGLTSQYLGKSMNTLGRKRVIMLGGKLLSFSFLLFSLSIYINSKYIFIIVGVVARFLQGCAVSMISNFIRSK